MKRLLGNDPVAGYKFWDAEETGTRYLTEGAYGAVTYEAGSLSAYSFVIGVLQLAVNNGLNLQTETPVLEITRRKGKGGKMSWDFETSRGLVHPGKVVLATTDTQLISTQLCRAS